MSTYLVRVKHDRGIAVFEVYAQNKEAVIKKMMEAEGCPRRAIIDIKKLKSLRGP
jgi:hypothetical protein